MPESAFPLMILLMGLVQVNGLFGLPWDRPAMKWLIRAVNLAMVLIAAAFLLGYRLRAPVPEFVPASLVLAGTAMVLARFGIAVRKALRAGCERDFQPALRRQ